MTFLHFSKKFGYIDPSGHFVFYLILCGSNFLGRTSPRCCSRGSPGGWIKISFLQTCRFLEDSLKKLRWLLYIWGRYSTFWTLEKKTSRSFKITNWEILELRTQKFDIRSFSSLKYPLIYVYRPFQSFSVLWICVARTF